MTMRSEAAPSQGSDAEPHVTYIRATRSTYKAYGGALEADRLQRIQHIDSDLFAGEVGIMWNRLTEEQQAKINADADQAYAPEDEEHKRIFRSSMALLTYLSMSEAIPTHHAEVAASAFDDDALDLPPAV